MSLLTRNADASTPYPRLYDIEHTAVRLADHILPTPVWRWETGVVAQSLHPRTEVNFFGIGNRGDEQDDEVANDRWVHAYHPDSSCRLRLAEHSCEFGETALAF